MAEPRGRATFYRTSAVSLGRCLVGSFDGIIKKHGLTEPGLQELARIVRGADTAATHLTPESPGLEAIAEGFRLVYEDDQAQLEAELPVYDALYAVCRQRVGQRPA